MRYATKISLVTGLASILGLAALFLLQLHFTSIYQEHDRVLGGSLRQQDLARRIQVDFKKQVQEWKDVLLRGHDAQDLENYRQAFFLQESRVHAQALELRPLLDDPSARGILEDFVTSHDRMGVTYREALDAFIHSGDYKSADRKVRGQDRVPTDRIDSIVALLSIDAQKWQAASSANLLAQQIRIRWVSVAFFVGLMGVALYLTLRFTSPILKLSQIVRRVTQQRDYALRAELKGDDEVGMLVGGFNGMLDEVQAGQKDLAEKEEQLRTLMDSVSEAIVSADETGKILSWNKGAEAIFGYSAQEAVGKSLGIVTTEGASRTLMTELVQVPRPAGEGGAARRVELAGRKKDGGAIPLEASLSTWKKGPHTYFGTILTDISERKKVDQMKNEFISTVSHELRTPLTSIRGSLGLLSSGVLGVMPTKAVPMVEIAAKNCDRLVRLVSDILDVEKIASGQMSFRIRSLSLPTSIAQAIEANRGFAFSLGISLKYESALGDVLIRADGDRLTQVLTNLISNACKFSPRGETVVVGAARQGGRIRVCVQDHGPGIPEEFRPRIFQKFAQADATDAGLRKGTGLGLVISKGLTERMGGTIGFDTKTGVGTTFFIDMDEVKPSEPSPGSSDGNRPRILICEDEPDIAQVLRGMMDREGFASDVAASVRDAKELCGRHSYAGMTLDLSLPDGNGLQLLKELRQNPATAQLPVIVVSASLDRGSSDLSGHAFGLVDWLEKPIPEDRLREALRSFCPGKSERHPRVLHVEDDPDIRAVVAGLLRDVAEVVQTGTVQSAWDRLKEEDFDLMIIDLGLPDGSGLELLPALRRSTNTPIPSLVFSAHEISPRTASYVSSALLKSKTSNEELVARVRSLLKTSSIKEVAPGPR